MCNTRQVVLATFLKTRNELLRISIFLTLQIDLLYTFADKYGVALVHTQGRFTEDGKDLIEAAKKYGSFVGILVDYDAVGSEIPKAARTTTPIIGIDKETIRWLQQNRYEITLAEVEEEYTPSIRTKDPYLQHYRIELDSVAQKVGPEGLDRTIHNEAVFKHPQLNEN